MTRRSCARENPGNIIVILRAAYRCGRRSTSTIRAVPRLRGDRQCAEINAPWSARPGVRPRQTPGRCRAALDHTDAHATGHLTLRYGVGTAQRGWADRRDVIKRPPDELREPGAGGIEAIGRRRDLAPPFGRRLTTAGRPLRGIPGQAGGSPRPSAARSRRTTPVRRNMSSVSSAHVRSGDHRGSRPVPSQVGGLGRVQVEPGAAEVPGLQRRQQRGLVDEPAARDVDEDRTRPHRGEGRRTEHLRVRPVVHRAAHDGVGLSQYGGHRTRPADELEPRGPAALGMRADAEEPRPERHETPRDRVADGAQANDRDGRPEQRSARRPDRPWARPPAPPAPRPACVPGRAGAGWPARRRCRRCRRPRRAPWLPRPRVLSPARCRPPARRRTGERGRTGRPPGPRRPPERPAGTPRPRRPGDSRSHTAGRS